MWFCPNTGALGFFRNTCRLTCCTALLNSSLSPYLVLPSSPSYDSLAKAHYTTSAPLEPACLLQPRSTEHISQAISILVEADDGSAECKFAIRGGGHNPSEGVASVQGGVTIDIALMNESTYHPERDSVSIMAGAKWGNVYKALKPLGIAVTGGRSDSVGVGGLIIGGGMSYFAPKYGLACDNVLNFEIVLSNSTITTANRTTNPSLFKALKGGGNNFGIVTKVELRAFAQGSLWGGLIGHSKSVIPAQIQALVNFTSHMTTDRNAMLVTIWQHSGKTGVDFAASGLQYILGEEIGSASVFNEFLSLPQTFNSLRVTDIYDLMMETAPPPGKRAVFLTLTFRNEVGALGYLHRLHEEAIEHVKSQRTASDDWDVITFLQPFPLMFGDTRKDPKNGNVLGLDQWQEDHLVLLLFLDWDNAADDTFFHDLGYDIIDNFKAYNREVGADSDYIYMNYAARKQHVLRGYGAENLAFLRQVAKEYDPTGVFQSQVPGGFKVNSEYVLG
ncbi:FAD-binding oxidoreductase [Aspergillus stella-maris]|uniref:FAD-binding oxidoreductase n=1 Tax=Aspergillus stella-maris TaxID=1810926 RepID=UPI003CCD3388